MTKLCENCGQRLVDSVDSVMMTTMALSIARRTVTGPIYSCRRRAMMSAWSSRSSTPAPTSSTTIADPQPPLHDSPSIVIPTSKAPLSPDAASPQTAARPPPVPKVARLKPTIRAQKAALTLVSHSSPSSSFCSDDRSFSLFVSFFPFYRLLLL
jgi:hypothetical protein